MIIFLLVFALVSFSTALVAWKSFDKRVKWYRRDYGVAAYGFIVWILLLMLNIGSTASLSNFVIEVFWIFIASIASPWIRVVFPGKDEKNSKLSSVLCLLLPIVVAIVLRLSVPTLPE